MNYPHAWRYRDYVVKSFNDDKPYDQFIKEQLAGDLMKTDDSKLKAERLIATGFLAIGAKTLNENNTTQFELDVADEQIDVTTQAFLAITAAVRGATITSSTRFRRRIITPSRASSAAPKRATGLSGLFKATGPRRHSHCRKIAACPPAPLTR